MFTRFIIPLMGAVLALGAVPAWSGGATKVEEILVLDGVQFVGDPPNPSTVEYQVELRKDQLEMADYAALEFKAANVCCDSRVTINGREYILPTDGRYAHSVSSLIGRTVVPIPVGSLLPSTTISFKASDFGPDLGHDDFGIADVYLVLNLAGADDEDGSKIPVTVRTTPYWKEVGKIDLSRDSTLFIAVMSGGPIDPTSIVFSSIVVDDFPASAMRGIGYGDKNGDGLPDFNFWYRLDRALSLECGPYYESFSAVTTDGQELTGRLEFEVVGCTP